MNNVNLPKICVMMSTYNGEKYLREQINSILNQKDVDVDLYVRDDKSTDSTNKILEDFKDKITIIPSNYNYGPAKSFMEILYFVGEYEYYAFADQDDIWLENKLQKGIFAIENQKLKEPLLYFSNRTFYQNNVETGMRYKSKPNYTLTGEIVGNCVAGCTVVFNKHLRDILIKEENRPSEKTLKSRMHDSWVVALAAYYGKIIYDDKSYILYRIHNNNVVGKGTKNPIKLLNKYYKKLSDKEMRNGRSSMAKDLYRTKANYQPYQKDVVKAFASCDKKELLTNKNIKRDCPENRMLFTLKVLFGWI